MNRGAIVLPSLLIWITLPKYWCLTFAVRNENDTVVHIGNCNSIGRRSFAPNTNQVVAMPTIRGWTLLPIYAECANDRYRSQILSRGAANKEENNMFMVSETLDAFGDAELEFVRLIGRDLRHNHLEESDSRRVCYIRMFRDLCRISAFHLFWWLLWPLVLWEKEKVIGFAYSCLLFVVVCMYCCDQQCYSFKMVHCDVDI